MGTQRLYIQSKYVGPRVFDLFCCVLTRLQGNVVFSNTLARKYGDQGIVSTSLNPGNLKSDLQRHLNSIQSVIVVCCGFCNDHMFYTYAFPFLILVLFPQNAMLYHVSYGALTQLWAGTSPEGAEFNGKVRLPSSLWCTCLQYLFPSVITVPNTLGTYWQG